MKIKMKNYIKRLIERRTPIVIVETEREAKIRKAKQLASVFAVISALLVGSWFIFGFANNPEEQNNEAQSSISGETVSLEPGIAEKQGILWAGTFADASSWKEKWGISQLGSYINVNEAISVVKPPEELDGNSLKVTVPGSDDQSSRWGIDIRTDFKKMSIDPLEEGFFRYYIYLPDDFECVEGGKIPGLSGITEGDPGHSTSAGGEYSERSWSGRLYWKQDDGNNGCGLVSYMYVKHANGKTISNSTGRYVGIAPRWHNNAKNTDGYMAIKKGQWNAIEVYYKMNTPGQNDGLHKGWVNGKLGIDLKDVQYRTKSYPNLKINQIFSSVFYGGPKGPLTTQHIYLDNFLVSKNYIGLRNSTEAPNLESEDPSNPLDEVIVEDPVQPGPVIDQSTSIDFKNQYTSTLSGTVVIEAVPKATGPVKEVNFYIDGSLVNSEKEAPYFLGGDSSGKPNGYDSKRLSNGSHSLRTVLTQTDGKVAEKTITIKVENIVISSTSKTVEAETATCQKSCSTKSNSLATGGKTLSLNTTGSRVSYAFKVTKAGTYRIGGTIKSQDYKGQAKVAVYLNGKKITTKTANSGSFGEIDLDNRYFALNSTQKIEFEYINDYNEGSGKDRDLLVDTLFLKQQ